MTIEEKYEDCDRCGERYYGEFIDAYLRTEETRNEVIRVCCPEMKKIEDLPEPVAGEDPLDRIVMLLNNGISRDDVYKDMVDRCSLFYTNKKRKQALANHIAQVDTMNVFATMEIPE